MPKTPNKNQNPESEARHLKLLSLQNLQSSSPKSALKHAKRAHHLSPNLEGLQTIISASKILLSSPSDHYNILLLQPFSHISSIKKQFKTLALLLHPDKSPSQIPANAFNRLADSFRFLSDRARKREYDTSLRLALASTNPNPSRPVDTFWTACLTCRLLHEFDRKYVGCRLVCPNCHKSFRAAEAADEQPRVRVRVRAKEKTLKEMQMELVKGKMNKVKVEEEDGRVMDVEDSDFYDFDKDRGEGCFVKGQIWAIYDDDDGMPRHYGLIEEVVCCRPFRVRMCWLDAEVESLRVSFGRFRVGGRVEVDSVNLFSHVLEWEKAAKEVFRIFPRKGSVWAVYGEGRGRCYEFVVFLSSYSEVFGLSVGYLEKVGGYKTVFRRRQIGTEGVRWVEKGDGAMFSHQIPARKLGESDGVDFSGDCWELDPASLPADLLQIV